MTEDTLYEISRKSVTIQKYEETTLSWHNSILTARTDKGIIFFKLTCNLECFDKQIDIIENKISISNSSPATGLFTKHLFKCEMSNGEYTEMLINPALWPHNPQITQDLTNVSDFEWSTTGFCGNKECALAVLNNIGHVELYMQNQHHWTSILNLSKYMNQLLDPSNHRQGLGEVKEAAYKVESCAICWASTLNKMNSCYFVTAQRNGTLLFWHLQCNGADVKAKLQNKVDSCTFEICKMLWIQKHNGLFLLVCSNVIGQILVLEFVICKEEVNFVQSHTLWKDKDRMIVKYLQYTTIDNNTILVCNKHRHLLILMLNEKCEIVSQFIKNIDDYRITGIVNTFDGFYVSTVNCKVYRVTILVSEKNKQLDVNFNLLDIKDTSTTSELYSFCLSANNVICALGMVDRKTSSRKKKINKLDLIFTTTEKKLESVIPLLLNNPTKELTHFWDCIELLRYKIMKTKTMPTMDYHQLYADASTDVYKLRVYLILLNFYNMLIKLVRICTESKFPETSVEFVKQKLMIHEACKLINSLHETYKRNNMFTSFEMECYYGAKSYIEYYCKKYEKNISEFVQTSVLNILKSSELVCQCCDDRIEGFSCRSGHLNMFCSLTFTLINNDEYLVCRSCGSTARSELYLENPMCIFCDLYLFKCVNI